MPLSPITSLYAEVRHTIFSALNRVPKVDRKVTESDLYSLGATYGRQLVDFAEAAGRTVSEGGEPYKALPCTAETFDNKIQTVKGLSDLRDDLAAALGQVTGLLNAARVDLGDDVTQVYTATESIKAFPGLTTEQRDAAAKASTKLYALREGRAAERAAAASQTRSKNQLQAGAVAERDVAIETLKDENEAVKIENKFLKRGALQPEDLSDAPVDTGAVSPRTAAAAPRRGRRKQGRK